MNLNLSKSVGEETGRIFGSLGVAISLYALSTRRTYHVEMEKYFQLNLEWRKRGIQKRAKQTQTKSEKLAYAAQIHRTQSEWGSFFPSEFRASIIVSCVSFLERELLKLCQEAAIVFGKPFTESSRNRLSRCRNFLGKHAEIKSLDKTVWKPLEDMNMLRNIIVHNGMSLNGGRYAGTIREISERVPGIKSDQKHKNEFWIDKSLCQFIFDSIETVLTRLELEIERISEWEKKVGELLFKE